nr:hypothetical protein [Bacteroidota bacterium]
MLVGILFENIREGETNHNRIRSRKKEGCEAHCMLLERQHTGEATASRNNKL